MTVVIHTKKPDPLLPARLAFYGGQILPEKAAKAAGPEAFNLKPVGSGPLRFVSWTKDDKAVLLVFYCQEDCWMSWNAAKRALSYGYRNVAWYPEGTDGWQRADLPVADSQPQPRTEE